MSKYSSDSDDDYKSKSSRRKRRRSESSSSRDSYVKSSKRRSRKSRSLSRDSYRTSSKNHKEKRSSLKDKSRYRSRSPHRNRSKTRRYRSPSRSRSRSNTRRKTYTKSKRRYRSRSRSHSHHRKSRSRSRRRSSSRSKLKSYRSRSRSSSYKRNKRSSSDRNGRETSNSSNDCIAIDSKPLQDLHKQISQKPIKENDFMIDNNRKLITIPSDDPIVKQEQLDDINASSFTPKTFKSSKSNERDRSDLNPLLTSLKLENELDKLPINFGEQIITLKDDVEDRLQKPKNETVFHDDIAFEDSEQKIQKWVKKLLVLRQKFLNGY